MAYNKHEKYGLTLGAEKSVIASDVARKISYNDANYLESVSTILNNAKSQGDLLSALDLVWIPLGSTELLTIDSYFPIKNFTDEYYMYHIVITQVRADSDNTIPTWVTSEDNGTTWDETVGDYAQVLWKSAISFTSARDTNPSEINPSLNLRLLDEDADAIIEHLVFNPADPNKLTHGVGTFMYHDFGSGVAGAFQRSEVYWASQNKVAHTALALKCGSGVDWTAGKLGVWGLEAK